ncbi:hypothetical protein MERGE_001344 [Pneumocystis wakefieldiae]|uniref:Mitochondrial outer membrane transport complex Sam37/metaxin N-terminal domain-containing protein n=1 Tax=Pneumocystis wakefieldiae TaxID=38082 RepID=A0A899GED2_9ASCO|nr:hypothetical protein MERGE_001344 [Pneumocystis wakefieldiae]
MLYFERLMTSFELHIHFPGFDLPSIDPYCLSVLCYLQITAPGLYSVIYSNNNTLSPTGKLPALRDSGTWVGGWNNIIDYLKQKGFDADHFLTDIQKADSIAYESLINGLGFDLTLFNIYVDDENYSNLKVLSSNFYRLLAFKLSSQPFIFGDQPTSLDCLIFGHLALQFFPGLPNSTLSEHLKTTEPLLVSYLHHSFSKYFQENKPLNIEITKSNYLCNATTMLWNNFISFSPFIQLKELVGINNPEKRRKFFTVAASILGFISYIYITGIIKIEIEDKNKDDLERTELLSNDSTI